MSASPISPTRHVASSFLSRNVALLAAGLVFVAFSLSSSQFATGSNIRNMAIEGANSAVMAGGMTFVIMTAGIDLSVGAILFLSTAGATELWSRA